MHPLPFLYSSDDDSHSESKLQLEQDKSSPLLAPVSKRVVLGDTICSLAGTADHASSGVEHKGEKKDLFSKVPEVGSDGTGELRQRNRGDLMEVPQRTSRHGLEQYLSRFDEAMKLRSQLMSEKPSQENGSAVEEFDSFRIFRLVGCALLAIVVRAFVCKYLVSKRIRSAFSRPSFLLAYLVTVCIHKWGVLRNDNFAKRNQCAHG